MKLIRRGRGGGFTGLWQLSISNSIPHHFINVNYFTLETYMYLSSMAPVDILGDMVINFGVVHKIGADGWKNSPIFVLELQHKDTFHSDNE